MKDYGNAGALCGALGCMLMLLVSMHFAKDDDKPKAENASAEVVFDENDISGSTDAPEKENSSEATTVSDENISDSDTETTETTETTDSSVSFMGPLGKDSAQRADSLYDTEVLRKVYPQQLSIVGDSIASGFGVYGVLDNPYDFATGNMGSRSINDYTFDYEGTNGVYTEVLKLSQPGYIYISMGMNDVNMITSDQYAENYREIITSVREICPDSCIIAAGITPISASSTFTASSTIETFNEKLKETVSEFDSPYVRYFDAGSYLKDTASGGLSSEYNGGDGIHLSGKAYYLLLENLYLLLDEMPVPSSVQNIIEEQGITADTSDEGSDDETTTDTSDEVTGDETPTETSGESVQ